MKVSILIGSRDRFEVLQRCVASVGAQRYSPLEILILDDNSTQYRLDQRIAAQFQDHHLRCFRSDEARGVAGSRNFLMQQATGDIFCVIDDDAYFEDQDSVVQLVEAFKRDPKIGIIAAKVVDHQASQTRLLVPFSQRVRQRQPNLTHRTQRVSYYLGTCHAIRRGVIEACGGYRADSMFGEEELDLSYRAIEAGFELLYLPEVVVHHHPQASVVTKQHPELYYHVQNRFFLAYKYLPTLYIPSYMIVWLSVYGLRAARQGSLPEFFRGIKAGLNVIESLQRSPLSAQAVQYLKAHYGRLWY
jgi:GT2 family glycosyltransferase